VKKTLLKALATDALMLWILFQMLDDAALAALQLFVGYALIILLWAIGIEASNKLPKAKSRKLDWLVIHPATSLLILGWWTLIVWYPLEGTWATFIPLLPVYIILLAIFARLLKTHILKPTTKQAPPKPKNKKPLTINQNKGGRNHRRRHARRHSGHKR